jgi:hypothetical protein
MYLQKGISIKTSGEKNIFVGIFKATDEKSRIRIRISTKCHRSGTLEFFYNYFIFVLTMQEEKQLNPASRRVRDAAEHLLSVVMEQVAK